MTPDKWIKKTIPKSEIENLAKKFCIDKLTATIFARRGITSGKDILYFMEDDLRFQHNPFLFSAMEDAVDRILDAVPEKGSPEQEHEKVLIFGDKDVDGVTATTVLYDELRALGINVQYKVPEGDDAYGLSVQAVEDFAAQNGSLIITVDCGISNNAEIECAAEHGIDVIVLDHHNPKETIPSPAIILNAKLPDSGYPFEEISGCAVVYKVVTALRFSKSRWYKADAALVNAREENGQIVIECIKIRNLVPVSRLVEYISPGEKSIYDTKIPHYLEGQIILCWDKENFTSLFAAAFGNSVQLSVVEIKTEAAKFYPALKNLPLSKIKEMSKIAKYGDHAPTEIGGFYNIFVTYAWQELKSRFPSDSEREQNDLQLVALAALADIMPMRNENRLFVKSGINAMNANKVRPGLRELMSSLGLLGKRITSTEISWTLIPNLNAAGRLGQAGTAIELFSSNDSSRREELANRVIELNATRKQLTQEAEIIAGTQARDSLPEFSGKLSFVLDERINRGVSGILAGRLVTSLGVPSMAMTCAGNLVIGSMRSCRGYDVTGFLDQLKDLFVSYGGHNFAAGFSLKKENFSEFKRRAAELSKTISLSEKTDSINIDAELPPSCMTPELQDLIDLFEPTGNENPRLVFMARNLPVVSGTIMGRSEKQHLKIIVDCGKNKWPCIFWNEGERLHRDFEVGDSVDILFNIERNTFNGTESLQLMLLEIKKSSINATA
ncbi:single-stranded-DNA-specific exonuclease RecJ [Treponema sp.]|uniref:single-stranded-DNA-specific exonuclease RecJ n=1 Tax=Treponema sp. TaxID=166 RepID=UPI003EFC67EB